MDSGGVLDANQSDKREPLSPHMMITPSPAAGANNGQNYSNSGGGGNGSGGQHTARGSTSSSATTSLNDRLNTDYVDVGPDEYSLGARCTKGIATSVGKCVTPRSLLVLLRVLKAITFCFLILTVAADIMYITFLDILADKEVRKIVGGPRDMIIRIYGLFLAGMAIAIELDVAKVIKGFYGFKGFIPRAFLLFFISAITGAHPLHNINVEKYLVENNNNNSNNNSNRNYYNNNNDDGNNKNGGGGGDDYAYYGGGNDDGQVYNDDYLYDNYVSDSVNSEIPKSAVVFQMVTSFILGLCAVTYFIFGLLCLDRFTSKAFLSTKDPLVTTAIPQPGGTVTPSDVNSSAYRNP